MFFANILAFISVLLNLNQKPKHLLFILLSCFVPNDSTVKSKMYNNYSVNATNPELLDTKFLAKTFLFLFKFFNLTYLLIRELTHSLT